ncbi:MAG: type VII secretion protein EssC [Atopobiaceae bacterium]|nr:type VII secretion protein EssC [Atopobiaceae bacterium]
MIEKLLITIKTADVLKTFAFDGTAQTALWVGLERTVGADNALARLENHGNELVLRVIGEGSGSSRVIPVPSDREFVTSITAANGTIASVYTRPYSHGVGTYRKMAFGGDAEFIIGRQRGSGFLYESAFVSGRHAQVTLLGGEFTITDLDSSNGTYVNGRPLPALQPRSLQPGDIIQILDLVIAIGRGFLSLNNPPQLKIVVPGIGLVTHALVCRAGGDVIAKEGEPTVFYPAPRLSKSIHVVKMQVDDPPGKKEPDDQPVIMQIGPSFFMGMSSIFMVSNSISQIASGASAMSIMPSITMALAMVGGTVLWPIVSRSYNRKKDEREEARRARLYVSYLDGVETSLVDEAKVQSQTLQENRRPVAELMQRAEDMSPLLMSHTNVHDDFMELRVGVGDADISSDISWPQHHFSLVDDRMIERVSELAKNPPMLRDVPLAFNPTKHFVAGILGPRGVVWDFLRGLLVQVCSLYSYQEVKIVLVGGEGEESEWGFLTSLGHFYDDSGVHRFVGLSYSGMVEESLILERELAARSEVRAEMLGDYGTYYLVVCADHALAERSEAISRLLKLRSNKGFSLLYLGGSLRDLPRECGYIIDLNQDGGTNLGISLDMTREDDRQRPRSARMFERSDVSGTLSQFDPDIMVDKDEATRFARALARVRLDLPEQRQTMPESIGFLEMFEVGNVAHLNIGQRWVEHDASQSLQTQVGIDEQGEPALLNLHESIHGPHGLVAGTTGSGKSEFIITYILSLCVNYAPDEVAFVLIDYKGGGLAGAFENERHHLPHLAGTITNLDGGAIKRSLVSIQSELKRRQDMFNQARDITGESTMDIYKYLSFYRQGILTQPMPHLFIVADEFAELKQQEPEFMDELISAARIGRSLGVHLILATQKPSGVVNDQIWSNSRFKVCLKVSDASDSREMIQRDDAAEITQPGRYYLLVGYNEMFLAGQAAYAGGAYAPSEVFEPKRDNAVELLDKEGSAVARMRPQTVMRKKSGSEIEAVITQIEEAAHVAGKQAQRLWLDPLPDVITLEQLLAKYGMPRAQGLTMAVGEADDPERQRQFLYTIDLSESGNVLMYGSQNSEVDELMQTMLLSLAMVYSAKEFWMYGIDLGAGVLAGLQGLPQCGGVVLPNDDERLGNLMRMLNEFRRERQQLLSEYGGSIEAYNERSGSHLTRIVVAIANLAALLELYSSYEDELVFLTREGPRYGIHFIVTASAPNSVRMRLAGNFAEIIPTMLNDPSDYLSLFGSMHGITPPQHERRGLVRVDKSILELQGASVCEVGANPSETIDAVAQRVKASSSLVATPIPQLPEYVTYLDMDITQSTQLPVGYSKQGIQPVYFDLSKSPYMLVMGNDNDPIDRYLRGLREALSLSGTTKYRVIDSHKLLGSGMDDPNVLTAYEDIEAFVHALDEDAVKVDVIVFTSIVQTIASIASDASRKLQDYIANEKGAGKTSLVCASELWRARSLYDNWYKVITAYGNGVWCGSGFIDQTVFRYARSLPEYRLPAERSDAFLCMRGDVTMMRLLEATNEPRNEG